MKRKPLILGGLVALGVVTALIVVTGAFGFNSGNNPGATGSNNIVWTGQGVSNGVLNTEQCDAANDPFGAGMPYLVWILTVDGGSIQNDSTTPVLHLGGTGSGDYTTTDPSDNSAAHFLTPFFTLSGLTANADINVLTTGNGAWNLVISHGCSGGGRTPAAGPTVTKDASGSYDNTYTWNIDKSVDQPKVFTAGGASATVNYKVTVSHDGGTTSNVKVTGTIDVNNPDTGSETLDSITDNIVDGSNTTVASCNVDESGGLVVAPGDTLYPYSCDLGDTPPSSDVFNNVTIAWSGQNVGTSQHLDAGSADFTTPSAIDFTANPIDDCVSVSDTNPAGPQGQTVCVGDANPTEFDYSADVNGDAGTCTPNDNTASFTTNDTGATGSAGATVTDCQGADLTVDKTANGTYDRECDWTINKVANAPTSQTGDAGQPKTFSYTVTLGATCTRIENSKVTGTITVSNPNDWEAVTLSGLTDALDSTGACTVDTSPGLTIPAATDNPDGSVTDGSVTYNYTCNNAKYPDDTQNTATATWDAATYSTPTGTASKTVDISWIGTLTDDCVDVSDNYKGSLGHFCTDASGNITGSNGAVNPINYTLSFNAPASGTCADFKNTASFVDNSTPVNKGSSSATVHLCSFGPRLTPGYWKNHLAPNGTSGCNSLPNGTSCGSNGPFASTWTNSTQWKCLGGVDKCSGVVTNPGYTGYKVDTIAKAAQIFVAMSCSFSGNSNNQNQQAIGCLAGKLLAAKYNVNINGSNPCINPTIAQADAFLAAIPKSPSGTIPYSGPSGNYTGITAAGRSTAITLQNALDAYDNGGGCH